MKTLSVLSIILLISLGGTNAQQIQVKVRLGMGTDLPKEVFIALKKEISQLNKHSYQLTSGDVVHKKEKVKMASSLPRKTYYVQFKGKDYRKNVKYDKEGNLLYSKENIHNVAMPTALYRFIYNEYYGWEIKKTMVVRTTKAGTSAQPTVYYKVLLQKGKKKERILLKENGKIYSRNRS